MCQILSRKPTTEGGRISRAGNASGLLIMKNILTSMVLYQLVTFSTFQQGFMFYRLDKTYHMPKM